MRSLLLVERFDLRPSNQYVLVRVIPNCFRFAKMCLWQISLLSWCSPRYVTSSRGSCMLFMWTGEGGTRFSSYGECNVDQLGSVSFYSPFMNQSWNASRLVFSFCEAMARSLSLA
jgi:hypothetical protein